MTDSAISTKRAHAKSEKRERRAIPWPDVLRVIQGEWARNFVLSKFREAGFSGDQWAERKCREFMAHLLTATEDALEFRSHHKTVAAERAAVRALRRRLELELWP